jgi:tetratricopeptide (TPR) repeat protein
MQMKLTMTAIGSALISVAVAAAPVSAQPQGIQDRQKQDLLDAEQPEKSGQLKVSRQAAKAIQELQETVKANNFAEVPAKAAAADAVARTVDDRYIIGVLRYQAATAAKDDAARAAGLEAMIASQFNGVPRKELYLDLGSTYTRLKQADRAAAAYQQALQLDPNSIDATAGLAELRIEQGQTGEALALLQKGIALQSSGGAQPTEAWLKRAVAVAYNAKLPQAVPISRDWVKAYPTTENWGDALAIYQNMTQLDETKTLDLMRLKHTAGALTPSDYFSYADIAVRRGFAGEAKAVLEEGFASRSEVKRSDPSFSQLYSLATERAKGDRDSLPAGPAASATARQILNTGDAYYGYGDYAKAVEFYRAALGRDGADADLINLHLGMALARQGDKAGATAALNSVGGVNADLAQYWLLYLSARA